MKGKKITSEGGLVYSTDFGEMCPDCSQQKSKCTCKNSAQITGNGKIRIKKESKGRGGKTVTLIEGLPESQDKLEILCKELKKICGCGGTTKNGSIEIQGEHAEKILSALAKKYKDVKLAGSW